MDYSDFRSSTMHVNTPLEGKRICSENRDKYGRVIDYLRISITDRCNLRCIYCMPEEGVPKLSHSDILSYEEILRFVKVAVSLGISKIRVTGGEPLVRKDIVKFCHSLVEIAGAGNVSLTTNGVLLKQYAKSLYDVGIRRINISLDTLQRDRFLRITRKDFFDSVWEGIIAAYEAKFYPVKLNIVVMRGMNDDEIESLASLTFKYPFHVRFIEFMPFSEEKWAKMYVSSEEILNRLKRMGTLYPTKSKNSNGPAKYYSFVGSLGKIGIISPISHHFCKTCNRLRLTADGKLRTCLFSSQELDFKELLRSEKDDSVLAQRLLFALKNKPARHKLNEEVFRKCISRPMSKIGG